MPPQKKKPTPTSTAPAAAAVAKGKPGRKKAKDLEESKDEEYKKVKNELTNEDGDAVSEVDEEEELVGKYGLKQTQP
jgi:5-hydroxyisourate hydrolase-like protein (transthyretin family)